MSVLEWRKKWSRWVTYMGPDGDWARRELLDRSIIGMAGRLEGKATLDVGCGEGHLVRLLAARGANVTGVDVVPELVSLASSIAAGRATQDLVKKWPWLGVQNDRPQVCKTSVAFEVADMTCLPRCLMGKFDLTVSCCSVNDIQDIEGAARCIAASLKPSGTCIAALPHPHTVRPEGAVRGLGEVGRAFSECVAPGFSVTNYFHTLSETVNAFGSAGLYVDRIEEPLLDRKAEKRHQKAIAALQDARGLPCPSDYPWFILFRFRSQER